MSTKKEKISKHVKGCPLKNERIEGGDDWNERISIAKVLTLSFSDQGEKDAQRIGRSGTTVKKTAAVLSETEP